MKAVDQPGDLETEMALDFPYFSSSRPAFPRVEEEESSETEDYLAIPREEEEEEEEESSETEDYLAIPRGDLGPGGDHAVRKKTRFLRSLSPTGLEEEESSETEDYLAIPREEEEEESSETEDYLA